jgi:hypothetical protein
MTPAADSGQVIGGQQVSSAVPPRTETGTQTRSGPAPSRRNANGRGPSWLTRAVFADFERAIVSADWR